MEPSVDIFMAEVNHPLKPVMEALRTIIKDASPKLSERIKWNAPSYYYKKDMAAFHFRNPEEIKIIFIFYNGNMLEAEPGLLTGDYKDRRIATFSSLKEVKQKKSALTGFVKAWVALMDR